MAEVYTYSYSISFTVHSLVLPYIPTTNQRVTPVACHLWEKTLG